MTMNKTAAELAQAIGARLEGDPTIELRSFAAPERAGPHDLIYVDAPKHERRANSSAALCVVAADGVALPGKTVLRHVRPKVAFAKAAALLVERRPIANGIHPTAIVAPLAVVDPSAAVGPYAVIGEYARIGAGTEVGAHAVVGAGCWIGERCRIHPHVTLYSGVRLGHGVEIHAGAVVGADGFGYAGDDERYWKFPQEGIVEIGDDVEIGANTTIDRGSLDDTRVGEGAKLDNLVHVAHNCQIGAHTVIAAQAGFSGSCLLGRRVTVGGQAGFGEHSELEDGAVIGGQSGVLGGKVIRGGEMVWGTPARPMHKFKAQYAWYTRLPELAARLKNLEEKIGRVSRGK